MKRFLVAALLLVGCGGLPADFDRLPLHAQVEAYEHHLHTAGTSLLGAQSAIAAHGQAAADLMASKLADPKSTFPPEEAVDIIWKVYRNGVDLRGTAAEREAIRAAQRPDLQPYMRRFAHTLAERIRSRGAASSVADSPEPRR
jgi:hypothetical protein